MNKTLRILSRIRGVQNDSELERFLQVIDDTLDYVEEQNIQFERSKRWERMKKVRKANETIQHLWETYVVPKVYKRMQCEIMPQLSMGEKVKQLEEHLPAHVLAHIRQFMTAKHLRESRRNASKRKLPYSKEAEYPSFEQNNKGDMGTKVYVHASRRRK